MTCISMISVAPGSTASSSMRASAISGTRWTQFRSSRAILWPGEANWWSHIPRDVRLSTACGRETQCFSVSDSRRTMTLKFSRALLAWSSWGLTTNTTTIAQYLRSGKKSKSSDDCFDLQREEEARGGYLQEATCTVTCTVNLYSLYTLSWRPINELCQTTSVRGRNKNGGGRRTKGRVVVYIVFFFFFCSNVLKSSCLYILDIVF